MNVPPTLLVISGLPAAGKTHLGARLAQELSWPFVSKDDYKELLHEALPDLTRSQAGPLSFNIIYYVAGVILAAGGSVVLETHFTGTSASRKSWCWHNDMRLSCVRSIATPHFWSSSGGMKLG